MAPPLQPKQFKGPWYHGTRADIEVGGHVVPGSEVGTANFDYGDTGNDSMVWLSSTHTEAAEYARLAKGISTPRVYEVRPHDSPVNWAEENGWDDEEGVDEWVTNRATVVRRHDID